MTITKWHLMPALLLVVLGSLLAHGDRTEQRPETSVSATPSGQDGQTSPSSTTPTDSYGDTLPTGAIARLGTMRLHHAGSLTRGGGAESVFYSKDGQALFTAGSGSPLRLWDATTGKLLRQFGEGRRHAQNAPPNLGQGLMIFGMPFGGGFNFDGDNGSALSVAYSPDGSLLAIKYPEGSIALWNAATGKLLREWRAEASALAFLPDGKTIISAGQGERIRIWECATGSELRSHTIAANATIFAFSADGKMLASVGQNNAIQIWESTTGKKLRQLPPVRGGIFSSSFLAFSPDGRLLATAYTAFRQKKAGPSGGAVYLWDIDSGKELHHLSPDKAGIWSVAFSPNSKLLATGSGFGSIRLWDVASGKELRHGPDYRAHIISLAFSPNGKTLVSGASGNDHTARLWDVSTGKEITPCSAGHAGPISSVAFTPDGKGLVSAGREGTLGLWDLATGRERCVALRAADFQSLACLSADGKTIASIGNTFAPDGRGLLFSAMNSPTSVRLWNTTTGGEQSQLPGPTGFVQSFVLSPDGRTLAATFLQSGGGPAADGGVAYLWNIASGKKPQQLTLSQVSCVAFSPDSKVLAVGSRQGAFSLWDIAASKQLDRYQGHTNNISCLAFSPDGQMLATAGSDVVEEESKPAIRLWRFQPGKGWLVNEKSLLLSGHEAKLDALAFSPDGKTLASASQDGTLRLWETTTGKERCCFEGFSGDILSLAFAIDGRRLAAGMNDGTILIWDVTGRLDHGRLRPEQLSAKQMEELWADLANADASRARRAIWTLAAAPVQTVPFLKKHFSPVPFNKAQAQRIAQLIADLDHDRFPVRQKALSELTKLGEVAEQALREAMQGGSASLEAKRRIAKLFEALQKRRLEPTSDDYRISRLLEVLEQCGTLEARSLVELAAQGPPGASVTNQAQAILKRLSK